MSRIANSADSIVLSDDAYAHVDGLTEIAFENVLLNIWISVWLHFFFLSLGPFNLTLCITKLRHCRGCYSGFAGANVNYDWASEKCIWYFYEKAKKNETENGLYEKNNLTSKHVIAQTKQILTKREWDNYLERIMVKFIEDIIDYWTPMINK